MKYYLVDTTQSSSPRTFESLQSLVKHLEGTVQRKFKLTRAQYMDNLIGLGYGYDDAEGSTFTSSLSEYFNIGVVKEGRLVRTNVHESTYNSKYRGQHGD